MHKVFDAGDGQLGFSLRLQIAAGHDDLDAGILRFHHTKDLFTRAFGKADVQQHGVDLQYSYCASLGKVSTTFFSLQQPQRGSVEGLTLSQFVAARTLGIQIALL